jgi:site-specific recombinase XerD
MRKEDISLAHLSELLATEKAASGKSAQTVDWYTGVIARYAEWIVAQKLEPALGSFTLEHVRAYIVALQGLRARELHPAQPMENRPLSDATINSYVRALHAFSSWLYEEGYTQAPVLARLKAPRMTQKTQPILTEAEIAAIVCALNPRTEIGARDQAIFLLLLDTGMRAGELCGLRLPQLHLDDGYAIVLGKGRKERPIKIGARAAKAIRFYLLHWRTPALAHEDHVFLACRGVTTPRHALASAGGEPLSVSALEQLIKRIGRQAGVERLHPHLLRHTFACLYLMRYRDPFALKSLLGHTTLQMTNHYCEAVQQMDVVRADTTSIVDGFDTKLLEINRRGRLAHKHAGRRGGLSS